MNEQDLLEQMAPLFGLAKIYSETGWRWGYENEAPDASIVDSDYGWGSPTEPQVAALTWVCRKMRVAVPDNTPPMDWHWQVIMGAEQKAQAVHYDQPYGLNVFDLAEIVLMFPGSLGYQQLKGWITDPPKNCPPNFPMAAAYLKKIVDSGYSQGQWYPEAENMSSFQLLLLVDFADMLRQISQHTLYIVSQTTLELIRLLTAGAATKAKKVLKQASLQKCIHPECNVQVDLSKKKSGACSKAHMNFECTHPSCVARAEVNGWARATHPFGTKIAKQHWQYRK